MPQESPPIPGFRVLVIVSRPLDLPDLPNLADQWALQNGLRRVQAPAYLKMLRPPTVEGLRNEILSGYDIVHFDGHGALGRRCPNCGALHSPQEKKCEHCTALLEDEEAKGYFAFERENGKLDALAAEDLAEIVTSAPEPAKLVFLSACESAKGGDVSLQNVLLAKGVPAVLGMKESVSLKATMALAGPFYAGLGSGMTIVRAFENALPALKRLENGGELQKIPVLDGPGKDATIPATKVSGKASFEAERLFGLPEHVFVGDYIRGDPPRGRKGLLSQSMDALLGGEKLVVLTGQGGIGKTVLAAEAARRLAWRYPGGVFWRSAAEMERLGLDEMLNSFDNVFGPQHRTLPLDAKRDQVLGYLWNYDTASLLVVDNAESIQDQRLWQFLKVIPLPSAALVTTREGLSSGGREIRVPEMVLEEASRLLITEARRRSPKWGTHLSPEDLQSLNDIARFMQGHPLAIKLAAALMANRNLASIREELKRNPPKKVSERFDVSYKSLTEGQRKLFCRLAVFSGPMTEDAVGIICIWVGRSDWQSDLGELVRRSFLDSLEIEAQDESDSKVTLYRYRLHPLMRQYAAGKAGDDLLATLRPRAAKYFLEYTRRFKENFNMLEWERENILAGIDWSYAMKEWELVREYAWAVDSYLATRGYWKDREELLHQSIRATQKLLDKKGVANTLHRMGNLAYATGNLDKARRLYRKSLKIRQKLGDKSGVSITLHQMAMMANATGNLDKARSLYQDSLKIKQELSDKRGVAITLHQIGNLAYATGDLVEAGRLYKESLKIRQKLGDKNGEAKTLHKMGNMAYDTGNLEEAKKLYADSLRIKQELGDKSGMAKTLHKMGNMAYATGNLEDASRLYEQSLRIKQELRDKRGESITRHQMGNMACDIGNLEEAKKLYAESLKIEQELGDKRGLAKTLHQMGNVAYVNGNLDEAQGQYQKSLKIELELEDKRGIAQSQHNLGIVAYHKNYLGKAQRLYEKSIKIKRELEDKKGVAITLHQMGNMAYAAGDLDEARRLYQESLKIDEELGDKQCKAITLAQSSLLEKKVGNHNKARDQFELAEKIFLELNIPITSQTQKSYEMLENKGR